MARLHLGRTLIHQGRCEEGQALLDGAVDHSRQHGIPFDLIQTLYWAADSLRVQGGTDEAAALFDEVLALANCKRCRCTPPWAASDAWPRYRRRCGPWSKPLTWCSGHACRASAGVT